MTIQQILFILIALVVLGSALLVVSTRNLFHAALYLIISFFGVAGFYVLLEAGFFAAAQVLVYIGAISILFIFAVMLTRNVITAQRANSQWSVSAVIAGIIFVILAVMLGPVAVVLRGREFGNVNWPLALKDGALLPVSPTYINDLGSAFVSFDQYAVPFLLGGVMLLIAMVGGIWVAREQHMTDILIEREAAEHSDDEPIQEQLPLGEATESH